MILLMGKKGKLILNVHGRNNVGSLRAISLSYSYYPMIAMGEGEGG